MTNLIQGSDLITYCPDIELPVLDQVASDISDLFCGMLPLETIERTKDYPADEVYYYNGRNKVNSGLLNVQSASVGDTALTTKIGGMFNDEVWFKESPTFDPYFVVTFTSGYTAETLPLDIRQAMIETATAAALNLGIADNVTSYQLGPRKVTFADKQKYERVYNILRKYQCL